MNSLSKKNIDVAKQYLELLAKRELDKIIQLFGNKVDWYIPGNELLAPWLGRRSNKEDIKNFFKLLWKNTVPIDAEIDAILSSNNLVVITGEFSTLMLSANRTVKSMFFIKMVIENGLIVKYHLLEDSFAVSEVLTIK